jgi:hypothetical protein
MSHSDETRGQSRRGDNTDIFANFARHRSGAVGLTDCLSCFKAAFALAEFTKATAHQIIWYVK